MGYNMQDSSLNVEIRLNNTFDGFLVGIKENGPWNQH